MRKILSILLTALIVLSLTVIPAADSPGIFPLTTVHAASTKKVNRITLNKTKAVVVKGKTISLKATVSPSNASNKKIKWTSSNTKIASVNKKGVVKGIKPGTATITAKATDGSGKKASCKITVKASSPPNVTDRVLYMTAPAAAKYLGLTVKRQVYEPDWDYTSYFFIRKGRKLYDGSSMLEYFKKYINVKGVWNLFIYDKTIAFQGVRVGMTRAQAHKSLTKYGWKYDFQWKDSEKGELELYYNRNLKINKDIVFSIILKNGKVKAIYYVTEGD